MNEIVKEMAEDFEDLDIEEIKSIKYALEDGEFLGTKEWSQEDVEEAHEWCVCKLKASK